MKPIGNKKLPLGDVFRQKSGLHTYWDHTLAGLIRLDTIDTHHVRLDASKHALMHSTTHRCANTRLDVSKHS